MYLHPVLNESQVPLFEDPLPKSRPRPCKINYYMQLLDIYTIKHKEDGLAFQKGVGPLIRGQSAYIIFKML